MPIHYKILHKKRKLNDAELAEKGRQLYIEFIKKINNHMLSNIL